MVASEKKDTIDSSEKNKEKYPTTENDIQTIRIDSVM